MKSGVFLAPFGEFSNPGRAAELAVLAEQNGWHGFFVWDHVLAARRTRSRSVSRP